MFRIQLLVLLAGAVLSGQDRTPRKLIASMEGKDLYKAYCASCHGLDNGNKHVNGNVKWNFAALNGQYKTPSGRFYSMSGSTGRLAPSSNYGTCNTIYCHSNGGPNGAAIVYSTITWGGSTLNCGSCHANMSAIASGAPNGGHYKHASTGNAGGEQRQGECESDGHESAPGNSYSPSL